MRPYMGPRASIRSKPSPHLLSLNVLIKAEDQRYKGKYKAGLVGKGIQQKRGGVEPNETYDSVTRLSSIRLLIAHWHRPNRSVTQWDAKNAFLNGLLDENNFVKQPDGFLDHNYPKHVCKLKRTLYTINQIARSAYEILATALVRCNLRPLRTEYALFYRIIDDSDACVVAYADDLLIILAEIHITDIVKAELEKVFVLKDPGRGSEFVGVSIIYKDDKRTITASQADAIQRCLQKFEMDNYKAVSTQSKKCIKFIAQKIRASKGVPYREAVGSLL